jgi:glutathione-regulated potassium-efflux system protein KefB
MRGNLRTTKPEPYIKPRREGQALNEEAAEALEDEEEERETSGA